MAGDIDWSRLCDTVEEHFGAWSTPPPPPVETSPPAGGLTHIRKDSAQTHIALAHRSVPIRNEHYYAARMAETILSAGMSSRLFTEVREKQGLVYWVGAWHQQPRGRGVIHLGASTTPQRCEQTYRTWLRELERLHEELNRRTRVARLFPNEASLLRLVSAIEMEISEDWVAGKRYLNMKTEMENENESANSGKKKIYRKNVA